jgi:hypothetical protein
VTLELANDIGEESLQLAIRRLVADGPSVCAEAGIDPGAVSFLIDYYGTSVVYGSRLRDIEAAARSIETQPPVDDLNIAKLTGQTLLDEVQEVLASLDDPAPEYLNRLHVVYASSMMSHGVDVDRFNAITMLGMPLTTSEFIQTTARIGRKWPGLVLVLHRMGGERDSSVYRAFPKFVTHGDRFIEPVAITRRSRRVLDNTFAGLFCARVYAVHEPKSLQLDGNPLSTARAVRRYFQLAPVLEADEFGELCDALMLSPASDDPLVVALRGLVRETFARLMNPASRATFVNELTPRPPMRSLREVETQVPIHQALMARGGRR